MQEEHSSYNELGFRRVNNTPFYPVWEIEVTINDIRSDEYHFGAANAVDLKQKMIELSLAHPGKTVLLNAFARVRCVVVDGRVTKQRTFGAFYYTDPSANEERKIFDELICADYDGENTFIFPKKEKEA